MAGKGESWQDSDARLTPGVALLRTRQFYGALQYFRQCLADGAGGPAWFYLGAAQHGLAQLDEAVSSFRCAAEAGFQPSEARCACATVLAESGETAQAEAELRKVLEQHPSHFRALCNLAILRDRDGAPEEALALYDRAIEGNPALPRYDLVHVHVRRARLLFALHRDAEALGASESALAADAKNARAWLDRILALSSLHRLDEAQVAVERGLADVGDALLRLPSGPSSTGQLDPKLLYIDRALQRQDVCAWHDRADLIASIRELLAQQAADRLADPGMLFRMLALPLSPKDLKAVGAAAARRAMAAVPGLCGPAKEAQRIRVGFLSPEFRPHPAAWLLRRLFSDRDRERFEFFAYALNPEDGSEDRRDFSRTADVFLDVSSWGTAEIIARLRADALDLLVDNSGYFAGTRPQILAARVAPAQVGWMGIACTLGPGMLDYRISDATATPPQSQDDWYEKLVLVPAPHAAYDADQALGDSGSRAEHALPETGFVFCCFNQAFKVDPEIFAVWSRLLQRLPHSVLWLLDSGAVTRRNLTAAAHSAGVEPRRLVFAPRVALMDHLGRMRHADLFLDTLHYGAHTTAADALHAGVPVLTRLGKTMASRIAGAFVRSAGIPEMAVDTLEMYEQKAIELAEQPAALAQVRSRLAKARAEAPFFSTARRVRTIELAFAAIVARSRAGLPPDTLIID